MTPPKAKDGRETLQERLQARIDKHRDPRGNICLGTYNHWDSALDLEAIGSLDAAQAEIARLKAIVRVNGLRWGHTHADIDALIGADPSASDDFRQPEAAPEGWQPPEWNDLTNEQRDKFVKTTLYYGFDVHYPDVAISIYRDMRALFPLASAPTPASAVASEAERLALGDLNLGSAFNFKSLRDVLKGALREGKTELLAEATLRRILEKATATPSRDAGLEEAAKICDALYGRHNEWATTTSKTVKTKADRAEMKGRADAAQFLAHRIRALASAPDPASAQDDWKPTHRHKKRGSTYVVVGQAQVQCEDGLTDYEVATVYRGHDGQLWVRRKSEFEDGRFEALSATGGAK